MFSQTFFRWNVELDERKIFFDIMGTLTGAMAHFRVELSLSIKASTGIQPSLICMWISHFQIKGDGHRD